MSEGADKPSEGAGPESGAGSSSGADAPPSGVPRWAADEPTAMWDEGALREQGFADAADAPRSASAPATAPRVGGDDRETVQAPVAPVPAGPPAAPARGLSWPLTLAIACVVAVVVYFAVRLLLP